MTTIVRVPFSRGFKTGIVEVARLQADRSLDVRSTGRSSLHRPASCSEKVQKKSKEIASEATF
jgi:hypothetical protein